MKEINIVHELCKDCPHCKKKDETIKVLLEVLGIVMETFLKELKEKK